MNVFQKFLIKYFRNFFLKSFVNKKNITILIDLFAIGVYADKRINSLEINELKKDIREYIEKYYFFLNDFKKNVLFDYIFESTLKQIEKEKQKDDYIDYLLKRFAYHSKFITNESLKELLLDSFEDILKSDKIYTQEEKYYFKKVKEILFNENTTE